MIKRPLYLNRIRPFMGKPIIKIVTGIRRCGKSVILHLVAEELREQGKPDSRITSINLELYANRHLKDPQVLYAYIRERVSATSDANSQHYLFFDEIQEVKGWEQLITGIQLEFNVDIYLTGSNAHFLSSEFATYLSGRYIEFKIYPFSFSEFLALAEQSDRESSPDELFDIYRHIGGFPFLAHLGFEVEPSKEYLQSVYSTVVLKDMIEREKIADAALLSQVLPFLIANIGHTFSGRSIEKMLEGENISISVGSVLKYVEIACNAHLLYRTQREDAARKKVFKHQEKYYLADHGLREAVYGNNERDVDQVLENLVFLELLRQGYQVTVGSVSHEATDDPARNKEIDFIASKGSRYLYIQVCYLLASETTVEREFSALRNLRVDYPKYVLSLDPVDRSQDGIINMNIRDFLLQSESILGS